MGFVWVRGFLLFLSLALACLASDPLTVERHAAPRGLASAEPAAIDNAVPDNEETRGERMEERVEKSKENSETQELLHEDGGKTVVCIAASLMVALLVANCLHVTKVSIISESVVIICVGFLLGLILPTRGSIFGKWSTGNLDVDFEGLIDAGILNLFLLPIIIFEAGWSVHHKNFVSQLPYILLFAIFGTLISMFVVGVLTQATCHIHGLCSARLAFTYAALISAVDPVATLATYSHLDVDPLLNILVFGESVVNDAVAIVLFRVLNQGDATEFDDVSALELTGRISAQTCLLLFGSVGLGLALGFAYTVILRVFHLYRTTASGVCFVFLCSFFTYCFAESIVGMSGIITVLFCAMFMSAFAKYNFPVEGNMFCAFALKQSASFADMVVFLLVGITAVYCDFKGLTFGGLVILFCLLGRAAAVVPLAFITNASKAIMYKHLPPEKRLMLTWRQVFMMWHAGLRGGIALVLTLELGPWVDEIAPHARDTLRNATVLIIVIFLLVFGGTTKVLLELLKIPMRGEAEPMYHHHGRLWHCMTWIRTKILTPVLIGRNKPMEPHFGENTTLRTIMSDLAALERKHSGDVITSLSSGHLSRGSSRRQRTGMVTLFGMQDPVHAQDIASDDEFDSIDENDGNETGEDSN